MEKKLSEFKIYESGVVKFVEGEYTSQMFCSKITKMN